MATYAIHCSPAPDGVAVEPCGVVGGVALAPHLEPVSQYPVDYSQAGLLFGFAVSVVLISYITAYTVGAIVRVVRSA